MKRWFVIVFCVLILSGCAGTATVPTPPSVSPPATASVQPRLSSELMGSPTPMESREPAGSPVPVESPEPSVLPDEEEAQKFLVGDVSRQPDGLSGFTAVSDGSTVYYRDDAEVDESEWERYGDYYYYSRVYRYNPKTKKSKLLFDTKGKGAIHYLYLVDSGALYYELLDYESEQYQLYCFDKGKCKQIIKQFADIVEIDSTKIDYSVCFGSYPNEYYRNYSYDIATGISSEIDKEPEQGQYKISYSSIGDQTKIILYDGKTGKTSSFFVGSDCQYITDAFVYYEFLYIVGFNQDQSTSTVYRIDINNANVSHTPLGGEVDDGAIYNDKWYFYISEEDQEESVINERIMVCNLKTGKLSLLKKISIKDDHLCSACLGVADGTLWIYCVHSGDGLLAELRKRIPIG